MWGINKMRLSGSANPIQWLHIAAAVVTIVAGLLGLLGSVVSWAGSFLAVTFCILFAFTWLMLFIQERIYGRKTRYAEATIPLHKAMHYLRDAWYMTQRLGDSDENFRRQVKESLQELARAYSIVTGTSCRTCIKLAYFDDTATEDQRLKVKTYCRNTEAEERTHESGSDWVADNSDFEEIMKADHEPATKRFFANKLPYIGYKNSHYTAEEMQRGDMIYAATIVWPIRKKSETDTPDLIGFLCVDSKTPCVFDNNYDVEIGAGYADALYMLLKPVLSDSTKE